MTRLVAIVAVALFAAGVLGCQGCAGRRGRDAAEEEIAAGRPTWWVIGGAARDGDVVNLETGLPERPISCDPADADDRDAHNAVMREAHAAGRLKGMSLERRITTRDVVEARFVGDGVIALRTGEAPVKSPDGRFRVDVALWGPAPQSGWLFVSDMTTGGREPLIYLGEPSCRVVFDDGGGALWVRDDKYGLCRTFDLAWPAQVQVFRDGE